MDDEYELKVLETVALKLINEIVVHNETDFKNIEKNREEIVYDIARKIYSQSGKTFPFSRMRELFDYRMKLEREKIEAGKKGTESTFHHESLGNDQHEELENLEISQNLLFTIRK